jgi:dihydrofolate reductase
MTTLIAAVAANGAIGFDNKLLYWLPDDMRRFRLLTTGHTIVMGRHTYESLPKGALPRRRNCVLSRSVAELPGCECFASWDAFRLSCRTDEDVFVIGGAMLYAATIGLADRLCLTEVDDRPSQADAFFPAVDRSLWQETQRLHHDADERHAHSFDFVDYKRF